MLAQFTPWLWGADTAATRKPNVVIFLTDDQGMLDANCYGSTDLYTPTMDALAQNGVRFTQAYSHTVCCPARAMLMTGRFPQRGGVNNWTQADAHSEKKGINMSLEEITIAEVLRDAGYKTALFGKWHLGAYNGYGPTEQGFDEYFGFLGGFIDNYLQYSLHGRGFHDLYDGKKEIFAKGKYFPDLMTERALQYIDKNKDVPFFMYVAFNLPHYPIQPDPKFDERYKDMKMPRQAYAKVISTVDDRMGRIMDRLKQYELISNTIVIFMSDNGYSIENYKIKVDNHSSGLPKGANYGANGGGGNAGKWIGNKGTFLEGGLRVPAIISFPSRLPKGAVRDQAITGMDWMPTVLALCGVPPPDVKFDGKNILPVIESESAPSPYSVLHWQWGDGWAVRKGDWKLLTENGKLSLVNLADPEPERKNHIQENPEIVKELQALHNEWLKDVSNRKP